MKPLILSPIRLFLIFIFPCKVKRCTFEKNEASLFEKVYTNRVRKIKETMPNACIGVDVIVGFPGETEEHFLETYHYLNDLDIAYLHVFTYSERPNTAAVLMPGVIPKHVRTKRKILRGLSVKKRRAFMKVS